MPDYSKAKVYKLVHADVSVDDEFQDVYVGSTIRPLNTRLCGHRADYRRAKTGNTRKLYQWFDDVGVENVTIVLLENTPCASYEEQRMHERRWCDTLKPSLNCKNPYTSLEERRMLKRGYDKIDYQRHREARIEKARKYAEENKELIAEQRKDYRDRNVEVLAERARAYYAANREKMRERNAKRYEENREKMLEYFRKHYQETKDIQLAKQMEKRRAAGSKPRVVYEEEERKVAIKANKARYNEKNKEKRRAWKKAWDEKNKEHVLAYRRERYARKKQ